MPRRTAKEEIEKQFQIFFDEAQQQLTDEIRTTRQPQRRGQALKELDALELVYKRFYHWVNGVDSNAA